MFTRSKVAAVPEVGAEAPEFNLPSAQGGQLRLSMRTVRGPVVVAFYRPWSEDDVAYFKALAEKEQEINLASGSVVGIGIAEPDEAREFARATGMESYVLYDYAKVASREWGLLEKDKQRGEYTRPAVFIVGPDHAVVHAWLGERPEPDELLAAVSGITGLPKSPEEKKEAEVGSPEPGTAGAGEAAEKPKKMSPEERERIKAERRAAREAGKSLKTPQEPAKAGETATEAGDGAGPKKMSREEREKIKAERRAAREAGKSLKTPNAPDAGGDAAPGEVAESDGGAATDGGASKKMSREERERIKAERRAAREAGKSVKTAPAGAEAPAEKPAQTPAETPSETPEEAPAAAEPAAEPVAEKPKKMSAEERERIKAERRAAREEGRSLKTSNPQPGSDDGPAESPAEREE